MVDLYSLQYEGLENQSKGTRLQFAIHDHVKNDVSKGYVDTDDEADDESSKQFNLGMGFNSKQEVQKFLQDYPLKNRSYYNIFQKRRVISTSWASYALGRVQDDFYLNLLDWSSNNLIGAACLKKLVVMSPELVDDPDLECSIKEETVLTGAKKHLGDPASLFYRSSPENEYSSCKFSKDGKLLAAGTVSGDIEVWDLQTMTYLVTFKSHVQRVGVLDWLPGECGHLLSSGSRDKSICIFDLRSPHAAVEWTRHKQEICGLTWKSSIPVYNNIERKRECSGSDFRDLMSFYDEKPGEKSLQVLEKEMIDDNLDKILENDYRAAACQERSVIADSHSNIYDVLNDACDLASSYRLNKQLLASGGNDNKIYIWELGYNVPIIKLTEHNAAVKALSWAPINYPLLASGGGTNDRSIRIWDTPRRTSICSCESESQVCNLFWSPKSLELVSSHGYTLNQVNVWDIARVERLGSKPRLRKLSTLTGHSSRALYMCHSVDGKYIATASGDGSLHLWRPFV